MTVGIVVPAYGRKYRTKVAAVGSWFSGEDWIYKNPASRWDGKYCSCRDFKPTDKLELRFGSELQSLTIVAGRKEG